MIAEQPSLFDGIKPQRKVCRDRLITTVSYDQQEIMGWITDLYLKGMPFQCDPTYSTGVIWRGIPGPELKYDIRPQAPGVEQASADALPLKDGSLRSLFFDPPFLVKTGEGSLIKNRFSDFPSVAVMWEFYQNSMIEFHRVLRKKGVFAFKCQDFISSGDQVPSQFKVMEIGFKLGLKWLDTFILINEKVVVPPQRQRHGRKIHSYFIVFQKVTS